MTVYKSIACLSVVSVLLVGCNNTPAITPLEPDVVLAEASRAAQALESVEINGSISFNTSMTDIMSGQLQLTLDGRTNERGRLFEAELSGIGNLDDAEGSSTIDFAGGLVSIAPSDFYFIIHDIQALPQTAQANRLSLLKGQWWRFSQDIAGVQAAGVSPNPVLLNAQTEVIALTKDNGIVWRNGVPLYHYEVGFDIDRFFEYVAKANPEDTITDADREEVERVLNDTDIKGQLWINAETYHIEELEWMISKDSGSEQFSSYDATIRVTLSDHNQAKTINPPSDAVPLSSPELGTPFLPENSGIPPGATQEELIELLEEQPAILESFPSTQ